MTRGESGANLPQGSDPYYPTEHPERRATAVTGNRPGDTTTRRSGSLALANEVKKTNFSMQGPYAWSCPGRRGYKQFRYMAAP